MIWEKRPALVACLLAVILLTGTVQASVGVAQQDTTNDVTHAQERLQEANRAYQRALAAVDAAHEAGADTTALTVRLRESHTALTAGVQAVQRTPPNTDLAIESAARAELTALAVEADADAAATDALAEAAIDREAARLANQSPESSTVPEEWIQQARQDRADAQFEAVERDLLYAQYAVQFEQYDRYLANLSTQGLDLRALDSELAAATAALDNESLTTEQATSLRQSFVHTATCLDQLHIADAAVERANRTSSVLVAADVTVAAATREQGYEALERGDYEAACSHAETATRLADDETNRVNATLDRDVVARLVDVVYDVVSRLVPVLADEQAAPATIHPPTLTVVDVKPVSVSYTPPSATVTPLDFSAERVTVPVPSIPGDQPSEGDDSQPPEAGTPSSDERADQATEEETVRFVVRITGAEECGATCRDVTATLRNAGTGDAHDVEADIELSVNGDVVWTGTESLGTVPAGETKQVSQRITLGFSEALQARSAGGVDVVITVRSDEHTQTIRDTIPV